MKNGFTLIEVMVVLAIIGAILVTVAPRLVDKKTTMKTTVRAFASTTREIHNAARLFNSTYRLVISMDAEEGHSYYIESAPGNVPLLTEEQQADDSKLSKEELEEKAKKNGFSADARILKSPVSLPRGLYFDEIEYGNRPTAINAGKAYIHFLPQGLVEEAVIHLTDRKTLNWTIAIHPITGQSDIFDGKKALKELRAE
jgi:general secretion pathway protein H